MIAPRDNEHELRFLSTGLLPQEKKIIEAIANKIGSKVEFFQNEMELWARARNGQFDLCILGQNENIPDPSYLIWLLKGLASHSRIILLYSQLSDEENQRLDRFHSNYVMERPIDGNKLMRMINSALNHREVRRSSLWSKFSRLLPIGKS